MRPVLVNVRSGIRRAFRLAVIPLLQGSDEILIGGQAVIEGVMMRSLHSFAVAVRRPSGSIGITQDLLHRPSEKHPWLKYPVIRGLGVLGQALVLGVRALRYSAEQAANEAGDKHAAAAKNEDGSRVPSDDQGPKKTELSSWLLALNLVFSLGFFILFYKVLPLYVATVLRNHCAAFNNFVLFNVADGVVRIALLLGFLFVLGRWREMKRLFEYHGAEHKVVWAFERTGRVDLGTARSSTRFHPRCGTSFMLVIMGIAMVFYLFLPFQGFASRLVSRIVLLPLILGVSYEFIRFAASSQGRLWRWASKPGLWLQRLTTREPDDSQLEISMAALDAAMALERTRGGELVIA
jgi:uncharacterized protein YqhQ